MDTIVRYWRIMPGAKSMYLKECMEQEFIGGDWGMPGDLLPIEIQMVKSMLLEKE